MIHEEPASIEGQVSLDLRQRPRLVCGTVEQVGGRSGVVLFLQVGFFFDLALLKFWHSPSGQGDGWNGEEAHANH